ncbi:MAG: methyltransferase domain-containing protein [Oscillospiraceae bacterium]|nr:methyltransferase domain-containing protein [Oscillospiraceae bacterium]
MDYEKRTEYLCTLLSDAPQGALVLDLACGTGTFSYALMERGFDVIGIDASLDMLAQALDKAAQANIAPPLLLCQKLEELDLYGTAQAAVCLTDSLNHITDPAAVRRFFRRLALFVEPGGLFVFDVNTLYKHEYVMGDNTFVRECDGAFCVWQNHWIPEERTTEIVLDVFEAEGALYRRAGERFAERAYSVEELTAWLGRAGFVVERIWGELVLEAPREDEERIYFVARKK